MRGEGEGGRKKWIEGRKSRRKERRGKGGCREVVGEKREEERKMEKEGRRGGGGVNVRKWVCWLQDGLIDRTKVKQISC